MRTPLALALALVLGFSGTSYADDLPLEELIVGTWGGDIEGEKIELHMEADGSAILSVGDDKGKGTYKLHTSKKPVWIDYDWGERGKAESIVEMIGKKQIRFENVSPGEIRPLKFTEKAVVLTRD